MTSVIGPVSPNAAIFRSRSLSPIVSALTTVSLVTAINCLVTAFQARKTLNR
jgi:hypothetical protein